MTELSEKPLTVTTIFLRRWKRFATVLGRWNTRLLLLLIYVLVIGPMSIVLRVFRRDLLGKRRPAAVSYWNDKIPTDGTIERHAHPF